LCDAPEIDIEEEQYGSVYPLEPGQYYKIHLLQDQLIYATGTATASGWGSNFRIYVLNGSGTYLATIANAPAYGVTAFPSPGNNPLTFVNTGAAADFYLQITSASSMTTDFKFQVRTPRLTVSPNPVVRGQTATFTVQGALGATISDWKYLPTVFAQVERTQNTASTTWPGIIVTGGYAQVTVTMAGRTILLNSPQLTENARSGWARTAVSHTEKDAGDQTPSGHTFTFVDPPTGPGTAIGEYEIDINYKFGHSQITDNGPNHGFRYVTSISDVNDTVSPARPTGFYWAYLASLKNQTEFYQKQCGTYDALNNPNGGISKENLVFGIKRHEALGTNSHYQQYVTAQNDPSNNLGIAAEAIVDAQTSTSQQFIDKVNGILGAKRELINAATAIQPPGAQYTDGNQYMGGINYFPYSPC
jgi:hypothetical protein